MTDNNQHRDRHQLLAALITLLLSAAVFAVLWFSALHYQWPPKDGLKPVAQQDSIIFGGDYVMLGDVPFATPDNELAAPLNEESATQDANEDIKGEDMDDNGNDAPQDKPKVTTDKPSPAKEVKKPDEPKPEKTGTAKKKEEKPKQETTKRNNGADKKKTEAKKTDAKTNNDAPKKADNTRVKGAFGKNKDAGTGKQGTPGGNSDTGGKTGSAGIGSGLVGYGPQYFAKPRGHLEGTVIVRVRVKADGKVHVAEPAGGTIKDATIVQRCLQAALASRFSVPTNKTTEGVGTIVYKFR